jgi:hypothetical protein
VTVDDHRGGVAADAACQGGVVTIRFDRRLDFANVPAFVHAVLQAASDPPGARSLLVAGGGINGIDARGEGMLRHRLDALGLRLPFAGVKTPIARAAPCAGRMGRARAPARRPFRLTVRWSVGHGRCGARWEDCAGRRVRRA